MNKSMIVEARKKEEQEYINKCVDKYREEALQLLTTAAKYLSKNHKKDMVILKIPCKPSDDFWIALSTINQKEKFDFFIERIWYRPRKIKVWLEHPYYSCDF